MLGRVEPLYQTFRIGTGLFRNCLVGVDDNMARRRLTDDTNNLIFLACHLTDGRFFIRQLLGGRYDPPFPELADVRSVDEMPDPPPTLSVVLDRWTEISQRLDPLFHTLSDEDLAAEAAFRGYPKDMPQTVEPLLTFLLHHEGYHIGQMALLRKGFGLPAMRYD